MKESVNEDLLSRLDERLAADDREIAAALVSLARRRRERLYLVGGSVRDLLLGRPHVDLDIAVEGDAIGLARALAESRNGRVVAHEAFGTATLEVASSRIDLAQARSETYSRPGALPTVSPASIEEDLRRRDFTVNAMALRLTPPAAGKLLDPHGGRRDLEQRILRVLHDDSFRDDATRMLRAVRYEGRLSFQIEDGTAALLKRDLPYLDTISGARLREEIVAMLYEEAPQDLLMRCQELGILASIHPCLRFDEPSRSALLRAREEHPTPWDEVCLCLMLPDCDEPGVESLSQRLALPKRYERALVDAVRLRELRLPADAPPSRMTELLEPFSVASVWALALRGDDAPAAEQAKRYLSEWRYVKSFLGASALKRLGVAAGPELGALLRKLRAARLDGVTRSREDELALVEQARE